MKAGCISSICGGLADGEERGGVVGHGRRLDALGWLLDGAAPLGRVTTRRRRQALGTSSCEGPRSMSVGRCRLRCRRRRGLACSFTGIRSRSTPSV